MKPKDLNLLAEKYRSGELSEKAVIDKMTVFVVKNYPMYGLHKYDEDFRQDIILNLLERGSRLLHIFNPKYGDFFTFLYCNICTLINTALKARAQETVREKLNIDECIQQYEEKEIKYHRINYRHFEAPKIPFSYKKVSPEYFQQAIKELSLCGKEKKVLILALKSSFYITDRQIQKICRMYGMKTEEFYKIIQYCKDTLEHKCSRFNITNQKRNFAYYHHKRCSYISRKYSEDLSSVNKAYKAKEWQKKDRKHLYSMNRLNSTLRKGYYLRTSNRIVANVMGLSERQVNYYMNSIRNEVSDCDEPSEQAGASQINEDISEGLTGENPDNCLES